MQAPLVSVCCITYNHGNFISRAIEGFLMQETSFPFEVIIGEDCSTDNTCQIIRDYVDKHPQIIKLITSETNVGAYKNEYRVLMAARGNYIAFCEGDDYWTSPYKLQLQVDFLEKNSIVAGCFHDAVNVDADDLIINDNYYTPLKTMYNQRDALVMRSSYASCTLVFRREVLNKEQNWYWRKPTDMALDLLITEKGFLAYLPNLNMAAYRLHRGGMWQGNLSQKNIEENILRELVFLSNRKFRKEYRNIIMNSLKENIQRYKPGTIRAFTKKVKYTFCYFLYSRPKNLQTLITIFLILIPQAKNLKQVLKIKI
jgi:glycosyltransferase involved in cell wall biosynthesis